jgi:hypothetical protein
MRRGIEEMDYWAAIRDLYLHKQQLKKAIVTLEALSKGEEVAEPVSPRGRKGMPKEEREKVSERMKRYWARRKRRS